MELYTEPYARNFTQDPGSAVEPFVKAANRAVEVGLRLNAGHDLSLENLKFFKGFGIIRSAELVYVAYKKGLIKLKDGNVLNALLYAVKFKGAAISGDEIREIERMR